MNRRLLTAGICLLLLLSGARAQTGPRTDRLLNLSSRGRIVAGESELVAGLVIGGALPKTVLLRGVGPALSAFGVTDALATPRLRLFDGQGRLLREVLGWGGDITYPATFARVGAFAFAAGSADTAIVTTLAPGTYTMRISAVAGAGSVLAEIYDASEPGATEPPRLINISTLGAIEPGGTLTGGFVIGGAGSKHVLVRGIGPGLAKFSITSPLADPRLRVLQGSGVIAENDNWSSLAADADLIASENTRSGAFPIEKGSRDAALILTLAPGAYTVQVTAADGNAKGTALVEIYELP